MPSVSATRCPARFIVRRQLDPARPEADGAQLCGEGVADCAHAGDVFGRALDVHDALKQGFRLGLAFGGVLRDRALRAVHLGMRGRESRERGGQESGNPAGD